MYGTICIVLIPESHGLHHYTEFKSLGNAATYKRLLYIITFCYMTTAFLRKNGGIPLLHEMIEPNVLLRKLFHLLSDHVKLNLFYVCGVFFSDSNYFFLCHFCQHSKGHRKSLA